MPSRQPNVTVVIPCHDSVHFVTEALESIFAQSYTGFEVVLVNDGSPETEALESLLVPYRSRIRYVRHENRGPGAARNTGILHAAGEYVAFLDSDDAWLPAFLLEHLHALDADPGLDMVYGDSVLFGRIPRSGGSAGKRSATPPDASFENLVRRRCHIHPSCVVARRSALVAAGLFDEDLPYSEDLDLWARLTHRGGRIEYLPRILTRRRVHGRSLTVQVDRLILGQLEMSRKLLETLPDLTPPQRSALEDNVAHCEARLHLVQATEHLVDGRFREASRAMGTANAVLHDWKLRGAIAGLRLAPRVTRRLWLAVLARHPIVDRVRATRENGVEAADEAGG
ncbi:MAG TPA: glycosyltransferase family A protein [Longimicrobiaceae bacterium]|nr:glycosyltransferase family A protein [Longimicrobiaceae bacterium]